MSESGSDTAVHRVVAAVAEREDRGATDLPPLSDALDPAALNELFASADPVGPSAPLRIRFRYCGYEVSMDADGRVELDPVSERPRSRAVAGATTEGGDTSETDEPFAE